jgi:hypothetical protein
VSAAKWTGHGRQPALAEHRKAVSAGRDARLVDKFNRLKALQASGANAAVIVRQTGFHGRPAPNHLRYPPFRPGTDAGSRGGPQRRHRALE